MEPAAVLHSRRASGVHRRSWATHVHRRLRMGGGETRDREIRSRPAGRSRCTVLELSFESSVGRIFSRLCSCTYLHQPTTTTVVLATNITQPPAKLAHKTHSRHTQHIAPSFLHSTHKAHRPPLLPYLTAARRRRHRPRHRRACQTAPPTTSASSPTSRSGTRSATAGS